jgi:hypothetical protein
MKIFGRRISRCVIANTAALGFTIVPAALFSTPQAHADRCYNGVLPGNPYVANCSLPQRQGGVRGSAPDAQAIIACRDQPGCLSWYVNGPH